MEYHVLVCNTLTFITSCALSQYKQQGLFELHVFTADMAGLVSPVHALCAEINNREGIRVG